MHQIVERCHGVLCIHIDLCIYGYSEKEHDANLFRLIQVANNSGFVFNSRKCQIHHPKITFHCLIFSKIENEILPSGVQDLQSFIGMINLIQPYILQLLHHTAPFRELLKKNQVCYWEDNMNTAFQKPTTLIIRITAIPYNATREISLSSSRHMPVNMAWVPVYSRMVNQQPLP